MNRAALVLVAANALGWVAFLGTRPATPWAELEQRRPRTGPAGASIERDTSWGTPLFGREVGGGGPRSKAASLFLLLNAPAVFAAATAYEMLEPTSLPIARVSFLAGTVAILASSVQWIVLGLLWERLRRPREATGPPAER